MTRAFTTQPIPREDMQRIINTALNSQQIEDDQLYLYRQDDNFYDTIFRQAWDKHDFSEDSLLAILADEYGQEFRSELAFALNQVMTKMTSLSTAYAERHDLDFSKVNRQIDDEISLSIKPTVRYNIRPILNKIPQKLDRFISDLGFENLTVENAEHLSRLINYADMSSLDDILTARQLRELIELRMEADNKVYNGIKTYGNDDLSMLYSEVQSEKIAEGFDQNRYFIIYE